MDQEDQKDQADQVGLVDLQGHFHLCYPAGQEDRLDPDSHLYHLFQGAQLVLGDPLRLKLLDFQLHPVDLGDQEDQGDLAFQEILYDP